MGATLAVAVAEEISEESPSNNVNDSCVKVYTSFLTHGPNNAVLDE